MNPAVSIITVYFNNPDDVLKLAESMKKFLKPDSYEWIVVDNNSNENLASKLNCIYLWQSENLGFGAGCNAGAQEASAKALFFVNPDCEFVEDCVTSLLKNLEENTIVGPQVLYPDGFIQLSFGPFLSIANEAKQKFMQKMERTKWMQSKLQTFISHKTDYVSGCALMIRAKEFRELGGFDEEFFLYNEDVDLCKRALNKGHQTAYVYEARIQHSKGGSAIQEKDRVSTESRNSQLRYYQKHHGAIQNFLLRSYLKVFSKLPPSR